MTSHASAQVPLQALIVDYGGVLTEAVRPSMQTWMAAEHVDPEHWRDLMHAWLRTGGEHNPLHDLETGAISGPEFEQVLARELAQRGSTGVVPDGLLSRMFVEPVLEADMFDVLRRAKASGLKTGLLSNSWANSYERDGWDDLFDAVVISGEVGLRKPDPEIFLLIARQLGVPPQACVFVDDIRPNIRGAAGVGMVGILHTDAATTLTELAALFDWPDLAPA